MNRPSPKHRRSVSRSRGTCNNAAASLPDSTHNHLVEKGDFAAIFAEPGPFDTQPALSEGSNLAAPTTAGMQMTSNIETDTYRQQFESLKNRVERDSAVRVFVVFHAPTDPHEAELDGSFCQKRTSVWHICIYRERADQPGSPLHELITLAHECGHYTSLRDGHRTESYEQALAKLVTHEASFDERDCEAIRAEERRAWASGRDWLDSVGFTAWDEYDRATRDGLRVLDEKLERRRTRT